MRRREKGEKSLERQGFGFRNRNTLQVPFSGLRIKKCEGNVHDMKWTDIYEKDGQKYKIMTCKHCPHRQDVIAEIPKTTKEIQQELKKESEIDRIIKGFKKKGK